MDATKLKKMNLVGVMGDPVDENPSYIMFESAFAAASLNWRYLNLLVKQNQLKAAIEGARAMDFRGFAITMPHKIKAVEMLDGIAEDARLIGAVNTARREGDRFYGENTDGKGFLTSLTQKGKVDPAGKKIACIGAGGAGRAICVELALAGAKHITVFNRKIESDMGNSLVETINEKTSTKAEFIPWDKEDISVPNDTDVLVNATPLGFYPNVDAMPPVKETDIRKEMTVCDVVPFPADTPFLRMARKRGALTLNGLEMLVNQGAIQFKMWTGVQADSEIMRKALKEALGL